MAKKETLKGITVETPDQEDEFIPTEEWYYIPMVQTNKVDDIVTTGALVWSPVTMWGRDYRDKQNAIDDVSNALSMGEKKIIKIKMPIIETKLKTDQ